MKDISLPECNTGIVYLSASVKRPSFMYTSETHCIIDWLRSHNSGNRSDLTTPIRLDSYHLLAYIRGFDCNKVYGVLLRSNRNMKNKDSFVMESMI